MTGVETRGRENKSEVDPKMRSTSVRWNEVQMKHTKVQSKVEER